MKGYLSDVNAKVKIVLAFAFILSLSLMPNGSWPAYILAYSVLLSIAVAYNLNFHRLLKKQLSVFSFHWQHSIGVYRCPAPTRPVDL